MTEITFDIPDGPDGADMRRAVTAMVLRCEDEVRLMRGYVRTAGATLSAVNRTLRPMRYSYLQRKVELARKRVARAERELVQAKALRSAVYSAANVNEDDYFGRQASDD